MSYKNKARALKISSRNQVERGVTSSKSSTWEAMPSACHALLTTIEAGTNTVHFPGRFHHSGPMPEAKMPEQHLAVKQDWHTRCGWYWVLRRNFRGAGETAAPPKPEVTSASKDMTKEHWNWKQRELAGKFSYTVKVKNIFPAGKWRERRHKNSLPIS